MIPPVETSQHSQMRKGLQYLKKQTKKKQTLKAKCHKLLCKFLRIMWVWGLIQIHTLGHNWMESLGALQTPCDGAMDKKIKSEGIRSTLPFHNDLHCYTEVSINTTPDTTKTYRLNSTRWMGIKDCNFQLEKWDPYWTICKSSTLDHPIIWYCPVVDKRTSSPLTPHRGTADCHITTMPVSVCVFGFAVLSHTVVSYFHVAKLLIPFSFLIC